MTSFEVSEHFPAQRQQELPLAASGALEEELVEIGASCWNYTTILMRIYCLFRLFLRPT